MSSLRDLRHYPNTRIVVNTTANAITKANKYNVKKKFDKQIKFLEANTKHPSLDFKPVPEYGKGIWRFRINDHYWGMVIKEPNIINTMRVYDVIKHP